MLLPHRHQYTKLSLLKQEYIGLSGRKFNLTIEILQKSSESREKMIERARRYRLSNPSIQTRCTSITNLIWNLPYFSLKHPCSKRTVKTRETAKKLV
jgi:hypothetical protein